MFLGIRVHMHFYKQGFQTSSHDLYYGGWCTFCRVPVSSASEFSEFNRIVHPTLWICMITSWWRQGHSTGLRLVRSSKENSHKNTSFVTCYNSLHSVHMSTTSWIKRDSGSCTVSFARHWQHSTTLCTASDGESSVSERDSSSPDEARRDMAKGQTVPTDFAEPNKVGAEHSRGPHCTPWTCSDPDIE